MNRIFGYIGCFVLGGALVAGAAFLYQRHVSPLPSVKPDTCLLQECLGVGYPVAQLEDNERVTLIEISLEQQRLEALVAAMVERFGQTMQPFASTLRIEQRQTIELSSIFDKYGVAVPVLPPNSLGDQLAAAPKAACTQVFDQLRLLQERLYNERNSFASRPDLRRFMQESAQTSQSVLMPAFQNCAKT